MAGLIAWRGPPAGGVVHKRRDQDREARMSGPPPKFHEVSDRYIEVCGCNTRIWLPSRPPRRWRDEGHLVVEQLVGHCVYCAGD